MKNTLLLVLMVSAALSFSGCGYKGDLYQPPISTDKSDSENQNQNQNQN